jgi:hypothetical protein
MTKKSQKSKKKWRCSLKSKGLCTAAEIGRVVTTFGSVMWILGLIILLVIDLTTGAIGRGAAKKAGEESALTKFTGAGAGLLLVLIALQCLVWWLVYKFDALAAGIVVVWGVALVLAIIGMISHTSSR